MHNSQIQVFFCNVITVSFYPNHIFQTWFWLNEFIRGITGRGLQDFGKGSHSSRSQLVEEAGKTQDISTKLSITTGKQAASDFKSQGETRGIRKVT